MNDITKIVILAVLGVILFNLFKNVKQEYAYIASAACSVCVLIITVPKAAEIIAYSRSLFPFSSDYSQCIGIFLKCLIVCEVCTLTKNFCKDSSSSFLASCIDLSEKIAVIIISLPLIESVVKIIVKYIGN